MLARRLTTLLPAMTLAEALETTRLHRIAGFKEWHGDRRVRLDIGDTPLPAGSVKPRALFRPRHGKPKRELMSISGRRRGGLVNRRHLKALPGNSQ